MISDRQADIGFAVQAAEADGRLQGYYVNAPGDCGRRHHMTVRADDGYTYGLVCNTRAMYILARSIMLNEPLTWGLISALRYVR